jgi:hypothetical protein
MSMKTREIEEIREKKYGNRQPRLKTRTQRAKAIWGGCFGILAAAYLVNGLIFLPWLATSIPFMVIGFVGGVLLLIRALWAWYDAGEMNDQQKAKEELREWRRRSGR